MHEVAIFGMSTLSRMHKETLAPQTAALFAKLAASGIVAPQAGFYLAGGTALALQIGHRQSEDLDFFTAAHTLLANLISELASIGHLEAIQEEAGTIHAVLDGVKVSFLSFPYPLAFPTIACNGIALADQRDIAAMKLSAVSSRGAKKDFFDIYFLMQSYPLSQMILFFETLFAGQEYNTLHILKSLAYFDDAEADPEPIMLIPVTWGEVKEVIAREAHALAR